MKPTRMNGTTSGEQRWARRLTAKSLSFPQSFEAVEKLDGPGKTGSAVVVLHVAG